MQFINWRMRVAISDTRSLVGTFMAFDRHMNLVLADCEEYRVIKGKKGMDAKPNSIRCPFDDLRRDFLDWFCICVMKS